MRWIDVELPHQAGDTELARLLDEAAAAGEGLAGLQERVGLDSPLVVRRIEEVGRLLFQAATLENPGAFAPRADRNGSESPRVGLAETDHIVGYHLCVPPRFVGLPWTWLHNGLGFLLERYPICASANPSRLPADPGQRPWMRRLCEANLNQQVRGELSMRDALPLLRPRECADPEILFVAGHCRDQIRQLIGREADGIKRALAAGPTGRPLARLSLPTEAVTPDLLARRGSQFQGLHFAAPTSQPLDVVETGQAAWLAGLASGLHDSADIPPAGEQTEDETGLPIDLELEVVGVDPITALLDNVTARAAARGVTPVPLDPPRQAAPRPVPFWLEDGPVQPEALGRDGVVPPLVFSNSYRSLPVMGSRFLGAGASTFVGPLAPLYSRPARKFAGRFYNFLADGHCVATALRQAALACRAQFGAEHPVWLSYGVAGYGSLALQYL